MSVRSRFSSSSAASTGRCGIPMTAGGSWAWAAPMPSSIRAPAWKSSIRAPGAVCASDGETTSRRRTRTALPSSSATARAKRGSGKRCGKRRSLMARRSATCCATTTAGCANCGTPMSCFGGGEEDGAGRSSFAPIVRGLAHRGRRVLAVPAARRSGRVLDRARIHGHGLVLTQPVAGGERQDVRCRADRAPAGGGAAGRRMGPA